VVSESIYRRLTGPIRRRLKLMVSRAVGRMVDPDTLLQTLQLELLKGEVLDGIEHLEGYGRTAHPPEGFEALTASLGGDRAHTVALAAWHRKHRPKGFKPGENVIYDDQGQIIALLRDKTIHIYGCDKLVAEVAVETIITCPLVKVVATTKIVADTPLVECTGNLAVAGNGSFGGGLTMTGAIGSGDMTTPGSITAQGDVADGTRSMAGDRAIYNSHTQPGDSGGTVGAPNQSM
jgi:phage baseplate assembly protein V